MICVSNIINESELFNMILYDVLKEVNLNSYANDMHQLYFELQDFLVEKFQDRPIEFKQNERIVFHQSDLDFYISDDFPGFTLYNLQLILRELDIPNYFCILLSNLPNIKKYAVIAQKKLTVNECPIDSRTTLFYCVCQYHPNINYSEITHPYVILSRQSRFHRTYFMSQLFENRLEKAGLLAYNNYSNSPTNSVNCLPKEKLSPCIFLTTNPFTFNNGEQLIQRPNNQLIVNNFQQKISSYKNFTEEIDLEDKDLLVGHQGDIISRGFIYVGLETTVSHPEVFLSTISFKGIVNKRPFIILGVPGTLKYIRSLGFKTFDNLWDESYDSIINFEDRVDAILKILDEWKDVSIEKIQETMNTIQDILDYNYLHYNTIFYDDQKKPLKRLFE